MLLSPFLPMHHTNCSYTVTQLTKIAAAVVGLALLAVQWSAVLPSLSQSTTSAPWKKNSSHVTQVASTTECILDNKESHFSSQTQVLDSQHLYYKEVLWFYKRFMSFYSLAIEQQCKKKLLLKIVSMHSEMNVCPQHSHTV